MLNLTDHFLIATPFLDFDENFNRSVIYIFEHSANIIKGLIINKPMKEFRVKNLIQSYSEFNFYPESDHPKLNDPLFRGGFVSQNRAFILHSTQRGFISSLAISDEIMLTFSQDILQVIGSKKQPEELLFFAGYSCWEPIQLIDEIKKNYWMIVKSERNIIFSISAEKRWEKAIKLLGINFPINTFEALRVQ